MEQNKMTPLTLTTNPLEIQGNDEVATIWEQQGEGSALIASLSASPGVERGKLFGKQLTAAYNATYGNGINPEAVKDMLDALISIVDCDECESGWISNKCISDAKSAILKAKL